MTLAPNVKWAAIGLLAFCELATMALWFSASAVVPSLILEFDLEAAPPRG